MTGTDLTQSAMTAHRRFIPVTPDPARPGLESRWHVRWTRARAYFNIFNETFNVFVRWTRARAYFNIFNETFNVFVFQRI